jgi:hypothetical protein
MANNPLVGAWRLVSYECKVGDGKRSSPLGADPVGYILYTEDGQMSVQIAAADRPPFASGDLHGGTAEEMIAAADSYIAYCGTYELFDDRVVHHVEHSFFPNRVGTAQTRYYELDGDRIALVTPPILIDGEEQVCRIVWERA